MYNQHGRSGGQAGKVCEFFLQGRCKFGDSCKYEHPGAQNANTNRFSALSGQPAGRKPQINGGQPAQLPFSLNKDVILADLKEERPQWPFSAYGPGRGAPRQLFGGFPLERSQEEMRVLYYLAQASGNPQPAIQAEQELFQQMDQQIEKITSDPDGAIQYILAGENEHPNRIDLTQNSNTATANQAKSMNPFGTGAGASSFGQPSAMNAPKPAFGTPSFGKPASTIGASSQSSAFGQPSQTGSSSAFGQPSQLGGTSTFGQASLPGAAPAFGQPSQPGSVSPFGRPSQPGTTPAFGFGRPSQPTATSAFGQPSQSGAGSAFGQPSQPAAPSTFGQPSQPGAASAFGQPSQPGGGSAFAAFGQPTKIGTTSAFGQASHISQSSPFGQPSSSTNSAFGQPSSTGQGQTAFGQPSRPVNPFSSQNLTGSGQATRAGQSPFAAAAQVKPTASPFVSNQAVQSPFAAAAPAQSSPFGQASSGNTAPNPFGQPPQASASPFGQASQQSKPSQPQANTSAVKAPFAPSHAHPQPGVTDDTATPPLISYARVSGNKIQAWRGQPVTYIDEIPYYSRTGNTRDGSSLERIWFPEGVPPRNPYTSESEEAYTKLGGHTEQQYRTCAEQGRFEGGIPLLAPRRAWTRFDI